MRDQADSLRRLMNNKEDQIETGNDILVYFDDPTNPNSLAYLSKIRVKNGDDIVNITMPSYNGSFINPDIGTNVTFKVNELNNVFSGIVIEKKLIPIPTITIRTTKKQVNKSESTRIICVASGKGGVGKTNFIVNLAITLRRFGKKILIIDADLGLANVDVIIGQSPKLNLSHFLDGYYKLEDIINEGPEGIKYIAGGSGINSLLNLSKSQLQSIVNSFALIEKEYDYLLIDTGAGISNNVTEFALSSGEIILVTTPEPTSITDAYAYIKIISKKNNNTKFSIVVNMVNNVNEGNIAAEKLISTCSKFLNIKPDYIGSIVREQLVVEAIKLQMPYVLHIPNSTASENIYEIANKINDSNIPEKTELKVLNFFAKLFGAFN